MKLSIKQCSKCFTIKLAGISIEVEALYSLTKKHCQEYLTDETPQVHISMSYSDIVEERELAIKQMKREGHILSVYPDMFYEPTAVCRKIMRELISYNIMIFHGAVMAVDGKAYLFTAKSGTGKTTHCKLWLKNIPNCHILNGDKPLLLFEEDKVYVCGSPWQGKENYGVNEKLPLAAICILERDETNHIKEVTLSDSLNVLINQSHIPESNGSLIKIINMLKNLSGVKLYRLGCNMEDEAALVSYEAMSLS